MKKKVNKRKVIMIFIFTMLFIFQYSPSRGYCQSPEKDHSLLSFYRVKQGLMSGSNSVEVKVYLNGIEIGSLTNGSKLTYKLYSEGAVKIKCVAVFGSGVIGQPFIATIDAKHNEDHQYKLQAYSMTGVKGEVLNEKQVAKLSKEEWVDTINHEEEKQNPVIKTQP